MRATNVDAKVSGSQGGVQSGNQNGLQVKPGTGQIARQIAVFLLDGLTGRGGLVVRGMGVLALSILKCSIYATASCYMASFLLPYFEGKNFPPLLTWDERFSEEAILWLGSMPLIVANAHFFTAATAVIVDLFLPDTVYGLGNIWANIKAKFSVRNMDSEDQKAESTDQKAEFVGEKIYVRTNNTVSQMKIYVRINNIVSQMKLDTEEEVFGLVMDGEVDKLRSLFKLHRDKLNHADASPEQHEKVKAFDESANKLIDFANKIQSFSREPVPVPL